MNKTDLIQLSQLHKLFKPFYSGIGHVLMFHRVCNDNDYTITKSLQVTQLYLESVIKYFLSRNIDIINLDECYNRITSMRKTNRFVVFTFDDGYADNLTHALPVFEKYNVPFSVFLATGYPDHTVVLWWYLLEELVMNNEKVKFEYNGIDYEYNTVTYNEKKYAWGNIRSFILGSGSDDILFERIQVVLNNSDLFHLTKKLALTWDQVRELGKSPLATIGAHTVKHLALSNLSEEKVAEEISESMKIIERKTGMPVLYMAYPIGTKAEAGFREFNIAKKCNVKMAFTAERGNIFKKHSDQLLSLPRIGINERMRISHIDLYVNGLDPFVNWTFR